MPKMLGGLIADAANDGGLPCPNIKQCLIGKAFDLSAFGWNRIAMRVVVGVAQKCVNTVFEVFRNHMLDFFGFGMDGIPRHAERFGKKELNEAMMADDFERHFFAARGELDAVIWRMVREL